jgi:hypothetical protein
MFGRYSFFIALFSISWKSYPLSGQRFYLFLLILEDGLLTTILSSTLMAAFISWMLAAVLTLANGISCPSVNTWRVFPNLPLSVGLGPISHFPLKVTLQIRYQEIASSIEFLLLHHHTLLAVLSIIFQIPYIQSIVEIVYDRLIQSHILSAASSIDIQSLRHSKKHTKCQSIPS